MTSADVVDTNRRVQGAGAVAIIVTVIAFSVWGLNGLIKAMDLPLVIAGATWTGIAAGAWLLYGAVLLLVVWGPLRRSGLFVGGALLALAWGGLAASYIAAKANTAAGTLALQASASSEDPWTNWVTAPMIEEGIKTVGIVMLALLPVALRFGPGAGLALGALVGVSFQVVENYVFTLQGMADAPGEQAQVLLSMGFIRGFVGLFSHIVYSGLIGAAIGYVLIAGPGERARRILIAVGVWLAMVLLHGFSNWAVSLQAVLLYLLSMAIGLVLLVVVTRKVLPRQVKQEPQSVPESPPSPQA